MSRVITATFADGAFRPCEPLSLPRQTRVRLVVGPVDPQPAAINKAWEELERLWDEAPVSSGGVHLTRDQRHERR